MRYFRLLSLMTILSFASSLIPGMSPSALAAEPSTGTPAPKADSKQDKSQKPANGSDKSEDPNKKEDDGDDHWEEIGDT